MACFSRIGFVLVAASILAGCASVGEVQRLDAELDAANRRTAVLLEAKWRYCGEMTPAAGRVEQAVTQATGGHVASSLLAGAIDWIAGKPVTTALRILLPDVFAGTTPPPPDLVVATRELSAGVARYCRDDAGVRKTGS